MVIKQHSSTYKVKGLNLEVRNSPKDDLHHETSLALFFTSQSVKMLSGRRL